MQVICLEAEDGRGVYSTGLGHKCTKAALQEDETGLIVTDLWHPSPDEEPALKDFWNGAKMSVRKRIDWVLHGRRDWYCGFKDVEQMLRWFPREGITKMVKMDLAHGHGIRVVVYDVHANKVKQGEHQVIFKKKDAKVNRIIPLANYSG